MTPVRCGLVLADGEECTDGVQPPGHYRSAIGDYARNSSPKSTQPGSRRSVSRSPSSSMPFVQLAARGVAVGSGVGGGGGGVGSGVGGGGVGSGVGGGVGGGGGGVGTGVGIGEGGGVGAGGELDEPGWLAPGDDGVEGFAVAAGTLIPGGSDWNGTACGAPDAVTGELALASPVDGEGETEPDAELDAPKLNGQMSSGPPPTTAPGARTVPDPATCARASTSTAAAGKTCRTRGHRAEAGGTGGATAGRSVRAVSIVASASTAAIALRHESHPTA